MRNKLDCYINGIGIISPQKTFENEHFLQDIVVYDQNVLSCQTPEFKSYINPIQLRRLSRMLRIGLTASVISIHESNIRIPDGIITASGYGFLDETEKFLRELLDRQEKQLTPTYFMQGTYNALAGLVALSLKCMGYNNTYVSKGFALENALLDAMLQVTNTSLNFLVGSYDEAAAVQYKTSLREGHYKSEFVRCTDLYNSTTTGTLQGEGSAFFTLSGKSSPTTWCVLQDIELLYTPKDANELRYSFNQFLQRNDLVASDIDVWISGASGDIEKDRLINELGETDLSSTPQVRFKHLCGEFCTAGSFGLWVGASILKRQEVPDAIRLGSNSPGKLETVVMVNHYLDRNYSFYLLRK